MAKGKSAASASQPAQRFYANLEAFLEQEQRAALPDLFGSTREKLADAKGTKAANAKKAITAIEKTEQLMHHLFDVKERLAHEVAAKGKK